MVVPSEMQTKWREDRSPLWRAAHTFSPIGPGRATLQVQTSAVCSHSMASLTFWGFSSLSGKPCLPLGLFLLLLAHSLFPWILTHPPPILSPVTPKCGSLILFSLNLGPYFIATSSSLSLFMALSLPTSHYSISFTSLTLTFLLPHYFVHLAST